MYMYFYSVMCNFEFGHGTTIHWILNGTFQACMDREKQDELPKLQLGWIDGICLPLYKVRY